MTTPNPAREEILEQLLAIGPMAYGKLTPVYRNGGDQPTYFKLQVWKDGRNHTRHVKAHELPDLQQRIGNRCQAEELFRRFVSLKVAEPLAADEAAKKKRR